MSSDTSAENLWPAAKIRSTFVNFFVEQKGHRFWPSSPVVPVNDPTLLFANSGMNQFKPLFLGTCDPSLEMSKLTMAVNSQKCIRAGGKHNDLEDVGKDVYHHTFFEMLGNWSFGTYFKEEAISWAWECLTVVFKLNPERLYATYFGGDASQNLAPDEEARQIWLRFLPSERILPFGCKDNFWEMGPTGPCGPCTEIHYDRLGGRDASLLVNADRPDVIEIWNNVFIQFNREADFSLRELPSKHVDTGMGFERLASILQGKQSNYDTDIFMPIFQVIQEVCNCRPYTGLVGVEDKDLVDMAYRVVADHIRTLTFAITDGAVPSSEGRGYVLRRILRRAVRYGQEILGAPAGFFTSLVSVVVENFSDAFPELKEKKSFVMSIISEEELSFNRTLDQGVKHFKKVVASVSSSGTDAEKVIPAKDAHILFTSMGFPLDLTELMAAERGFTVDTLGFHELMKQDRLTSEAAEALRKGGGSKDLSMEAEQTAWLQNQNIDVTDSSSKYTWNQPHETKIVALFLGRGGEGAGFRNEVTAGDGLIGVILSSTSFYYESGGQASDSGNLITEKTNFRVDYAQTYGGYVVHVGQLLEGEKLVVGQTISSEVDYVKRSLVAPNHTMTHVLNLALKTVLMEGKLSQGLCDQKGSQVDADKLRFDFSWGSSLSSPQVAQIESIVKEKINSKVPVYNEVVPLNDAMKISALRRVFGESYPDPVRVVSVGVDIRTLLTDPENSQWEAVSVEFCGGTHLSNTAEAEDFVLIEESGIAKGVRRISGLTRDLAKQARQRAADILSRLETMKKMPGGPELLALSKTVKMEVDQAVVSLVDKDKMRAELVKISDILKAWQKTLSASRTATAMTAIDTIAADSLTSAKPIIIENLEFGADGKVAKKIQDKFRSVNVTASFFVTSMDDDEEKIGLFPIVSADHVTAGLNAKEWCDHCIAAVGAGKGGGRAELANATIPGDRAVLLVVLTAAKEYASSKLGISL